MKHNRKQCFRCVRRVMISLSILKIFEVAQSVQVYVQLSHVSLYCLASIRKGTTFQEIHSSFFISSLSLLLGYSRGLVLLDPRVLVGGRAILLSMPAVILAAGKCSRSADNCIMHTSRKKTLQRQIGEQFRSR